LRAIRAGLRRLSRTTVTETVETLIESKTDDVVRTLADDACPSAPTVSTRDLNATHSIKVRHGKAKKEYEALKADIKENGITNPIKYVEHNGVKYVVDGHHRLRAARELGLTDVPAERVKLPFGGYRGPDDLIYGP
jgi:hypothetical protein